MSDLDEKGTPLAAREGVADRWAPFTDAELDQLHDWLEMAELELPGTDEHPLYVSLEAAWRERGLHDRWVITSVHGPVAVRRRRSEFEAAAT